MRFFLRSILFILFTLILSSTVNASGNRVKLFYFQKSDEFMKSFQFTMKKMAETNGIDLVEYDANSSAEAQLIKVRESIELGDKLIISVYDNENVYEYVNLAKENDAKLILFGFNPVKEALDSYKDAWFVGILIRI